MTTRTDFTPEEWSLIKKTLHQPGAAVMLAAPGGGLREMLALAQGVIEALEKFQHSELIKTLLKETEIRDTETKHAQTAQSPKSFMDEMTANLQKAVKAVRAKATAQEVEDYQALVLFLAEKIASASAEGGFMGMGEKRITADEQRVLDEIRLELHRKT